MIKKEELENPQSCLNKAYPNEPLFVLLGRDKSAPVAIRAWATHRLATGKNGETDPQIREAFQMADDMENERYTY